MRRVLLCFISMVILVFNGSLVNAAENGENNIFGKEWSYIKV